MTSEDAFILKTKLSEETINYQQILEQTHAQALFQNEVETTRWELYKKEHTDLITRLLSFRDNLSHAVMVPIGKKALIKGSLVHTNEILVCLGDGWFAKQSAKQACDVCHRRIENCNEMLKKLEKEKDLLTTRKSLPLENEVFSAGDTQEIIEPYDEDEERKWKERHRQKEKEYRKKLADLKTQNTKIETEEDLWKRLDNLDLQEDLEDELDRLNEEDDDDDDSENDEKTEESSSEEEAKNDDTGQAQELEQIYKKQTLKRRVSFKEGVKSEHNDKQSEEISGEMIKITFKHSDMPSFVSPSSESEINNPSDVYSQYVRQKAPKSILKTSSSMEMLPHPMVDHGGGTNVAYNYSKTVKCEENVPHLIREPVVQAIGEVFERTVEPPTAVTNDQRPVSRFKASRLAKR